MIICVCGGRDYSNRDRVFRVLDAAVAVLGSDSVMIMNGAARGADKLTY